MHFSGVLQPRFKGSPGSVPDGQLPLDEKRRFADEVSNGLRSDIWVCVDHANGCQPRFVVPPEKRLGRITGAYIDHAENLVVTGTVDSSRPEAAGIMLSILKNKVPWGLSACAPSLSFND
jgi:hypothetical protein